MISIWLSQLACTGVCTRMRFGHAFCKCLQDALAAMTATVVDDPEHPPRVLYGLG